MTPRIPHPLAACPHERTLARQEASLAGEEAAASPSAEAAAAVLASARPHERPLCVRPQLLPLLATLVEDSAVQEVVTASA